MARAGDSQFVHHQLHGIYFGLAMAGADGDSASRNGKAVDRCLQRFAVADIVDRRFDTFAAGQPAHFG